jgi:hypothetical protein
MAISSSGTMASPVRLVDPYATAMRLLRIAASALRRAADVIDPPAQGGYPRQSAEPVGMFVLDFTTGEVRYNGQVIGHG